MEIEKKLFYGKKSHNKKYVIYCKREVKNMKKIGCSCDYDCSGISLVASIIIGIIAGMLRYTGTITITSSFLWVVFGIGIVYFALILGISAFFDLSGGSCACNSVPGIVIGALGTILSSLILLGIEFAVTSVVGVIITGAMFFFVSLLFTLIACLIRCLANCEE